jgi:hypothetical protein
MTVKELGGTVTMRVSPLGSSDPSLHRDTFGIRSRSVGVAFALPCNGAGIG